MNKKRKILTGDFIRGLKWKTCLRICVFNTLKHQKVTFTT